MLSLKLILESNKLFNISGFVSMTESFGLNREIYSLLLFKPLYKNFIAITNTYLILFAQPCSTAVFSLCAAIAHWQLNLLSVASSKGKNEVRAMKFLQGGSEQESKKMWFGNRFINLRTCCLLISIAPIKNVRNFTI